MCFTEPADTYHPVIPLRVDQAQLITEVSTFFKLAPSKVKALYRTCRAIHTEQRYAERLGEQKTLCFEEAFVIFVMFATNRPNTIVEIGSQFGSSSRRIIDMNQRLGFESRVICFDITDRIRYFSAAEAKLIIKDTTGCFRRAVLRSWQPEFIFLDAHPYHLVKEIITETLADPRQPILAIHDCSRDLCNPQMTLAQDDPRVTSETGVWERHILAELFEIGDPLSPQLDRAETPSHRLAVFGTPHGLAVLYPKRSHHGE